MTGSGISLNSGIPDFTKYYSQVFATFHKYNLPYPEALFDLGYFR